ncbi:MAG: SufD family Fe-S cluster assembly protein [Desulfuromonadales bacterium]|jgi:Fe-S cluster assembly scaffold protein SufB
MTELEKILEALETTGSDRSILKDPATAHLMVEGSRILSERQIEGLRVEAKSTGDGIIARVQVVRGARILKPVHLCFGMVHAGLQKITMEVRLEEDSSAHFIAHCLFPEPRQVSHLMDAAVDIGPGAEMCYSETHLHGPYGTVEVVPKAHVRIGKNGRYMGDFNLTAGRVGRLAIDYTVEAGENAVAELTARVYGHETDRIAIREQVTLAGANARSLIKTRVALEGEAEAEVTGITEGNAPGARGHVDCMELVRERAVARAIPIVNVTNPLAKVTHEAAIGSVDRRQLETLMAHGLSADEAVDIIVRGILR